MHVHNIRTKYTFGDRVRVDSAAQRCKATGTVFVITFDGHGQVDYMIEVDGQDAIQGGILEEDISPLDAQPEPTE